MVIHIWRYLLNFGSHCTTLDVSSLNRKNSTFRPRNREKDQYSDADPFELQICMIEGTRNGIDRCLELLREKFPLQQYQVIRQKYT